MTRKSIRAMSNIVPTDSAGTRAAIFLCHDGIQYAAKEKQIKQTKKVFTLHLMPHPAINF